jgi:hypothetical protein
MISAAVENYEKLEVSKLRPVHIPEPEVSSWVQHVSLAVSNM